MMVLFPTLAATCSTGNRIQTFLLEEPSPFTCRLLHPLPSAVEWLRPPCCPLSARSGTAGPGLPPPPSILHLLLHLHHHHHLSHLLALLCICFTLVVLVSFRLRPVGRHLTSQPIIQSPVLEGLHLVPPDVLLLCSPCPCLFPQNNLTWCQTFHVKFQPELCQNQMSHD